MSLLFLLFAANYTFPIGEYEPLEDNEACEIFNARIVRFEGEKSDRLILSATLSFLLEKGRRVSKDVSLCRYTYDTVINDSKKAFKIKRITTVDKCKEMTGNRMITEVLETKDGGFEYYIKTIHLNDPDKIIGEMKCTYTKS